MTCVATALITILLTGCASTQNRGTVTKAANASEVYQLLSSRHPDGISVQDAIAFMSAEGFHCSREESSNFTEKVVNRDGSVTSTEHAAIDFIRCNRQTQDGFVETVFSVALVIENQRVVQAFGDRSFVGP